MTDNGPRIVFMGTPEFAVASLRALKESGFNISAAITVTDKPAGRGRKLSISPVKEYALGAGIPLLQPEKMRDPSFIGRLREINADIFVIVAFRMLPEEVWGLPRFGTLNLHASLLPQYRGAAPINHAIINGETKTGVTTFLIDNDIDTGEILLARETEIGPEETAGQLHDRMMIIGAELVLETVKGLYEKRLKPQTQIIPDNTILHKAPKIFPSDTVINWHDPAGKIHNKIRGLSPVPAATTTLSSKNNKLKIKLYESRLADDIQAAPQDIIVTGRKQLFIGCENGALEIISLQAEGRKRMTSAEFLRGTDLSGWRAS